MKWLSIVLSALLCALLATCVSSWVIPITSVQIDTVTKVPQLGANACTWGPSFWCSNITNAKSCKAVKHCIKHAWEIQPVPKDHDSICDICTKMVKEARDQLESNETQEELREVFEGSCRLIPLKIIANECVKLADDFVPELVETLASQMNPTQICTIAGLCNSRRIDEMLAAREKENDAKKLSNKVAQDACEGCHTVIKLLRSNFDHSSRDQVLQGLLRFCGKMSSLSDGCTNIILTYFDQIYNHLQTYLDPKDVCIMTGSCYLQFHKHEIDVDIVSLSEIGKVTPQNDKDELPCKLCEQLVQHLRELLIANTTEAEFQQVLEGVCKQTKSFKDECLAIVDTYYPQIYNFIVSELNPEEACQMIGICPNGKKSMAYPFAPLLPVETAIKAEKMLGPELSTKQKLAHVPLEKSQGNVQIITPELAQLPIERMMPPALTLTGNTKLCALCQYFLHFVQTEISDAKNEEEIKKAVTSACGKLPRTIGNECANFVDQYGDALVALLAQELDPAQICPLLSLCPSHNLQEVEILIKSKPKDKPNCPLCLFAVTQLEQMIKNQKTEESIRNALSGLCKHLPKNLAPECEDFVKVYTDELVEMLIADLTPQEVCVYLKLCNTTPTRAPRPWAHIEGTGMENLDEEEMTNEIPDDTVEGKKFTEIKSTKVGSPQCVICEYIMSQIEDELKDRKNEEHIKHIVHNVCNVLPKSVSKECNDFVDKYADLVIKLLVKEMEPSEICSVMLLCSSKKLAAVGEIRECAICEAAVAVMEKLFNNPNVNKTMEHILEKTCLALPVKYEQKCEKMIEYYGDTFFYFIMKFGSHKVCHHIGMCATRVARPEQALLGGKKCTQGPAFWCTEEAKEHGCHRNDETLCAIYRQKRDTPVVGADPCTWGPSFHCSEKAKAHGCYNNNKAFCAKYKQKRDTTVVGAKPCTWGPSFWCDEAAKAHGCYRDDELCTNYAASKQQP